MTKQEREAVVELLRCAADERPERVGLNGLLEFAAGYDLERAFAALNAARGGRFVRVTDGRVDEQYRHELLEAAQRVEDCEWP